MEDTQHIAVNSVINSIDRNSGNRLAHFTRCTEMSWNVCEICITSDLIGVRSIVYSESTGSDENVLCVYYSVKSRCGGRERPFYSFMIECTFIFQQA